MARMPVPGSDEGTWGDILNNFLAQSHNPDGTLQSAAIPDGSVTPAKLSQAYVPTAEKGSANGVATLDGSGKVPSSQLPPGGSTPDATTTSKGIVQLAGDLAGTAAAPTVPGLSTKADDANVMHLAGVETVTGAKDFTGGATINGTNIIVGTDARLTDQRVPTDGSVTDVKVSASAAIAQSKIANLTSDLASKEPTVATGTTSQYYRGDKSWQALDKTAVGLANVDNTSDANKPISTATQTALNAKADDTAVIHNTLVDVKGDLIVATANDTVTRLAAGTNGQVLTADSAQPTGVKWATTASGGTVLLDYTATPSASVPAGTPVGTIVFMKASTASTTTWDFRGLGALPAGWTRRGVASETFDATGMTATYTSGQAHYYSLGATYSTGTFEIKMISGPTTGVFLGAQMFSTVNNLGAAVHWYNAPSGALVSDMGSTHAYSSSTYANAGGAPAYPAYFRIRYAAGKVYGSYSTDGSIWSAEATITWNLGGITEIAVGSSYSGSTATFEYAKWTSSPLAGGLVGWWDGSVIQSFS